MRTIINGQAASRALRAVRLRAGTVIGGPLSVSGHLPLRTLELISRAEDVTMIHQKIFPTIQ
jgi:hypothetical protein